MTNLIDLLNGQLSDGLIESMANQLGGADKKQTADATSAIVSMMTKALAKNSATPEGRNALAGALDRDHDGSILDDLMGYATGNMQQPAQNTSMLNGAGILKHILGGKQNGAIDMISQMSGLGKGQTGNLMAMLAPVIMGMLGKQKKQENLDGGGLFDMLNNSVKSQPTNKRKEMSMFEKLIDQDGDGQIMDDVTGFGLKWLTGKLFGRR
ncbi:MAG: DUF937 domain-containing protein [Bacteroidota bacterium]